MHCGDQRHLGLCLGYVPALAYGSCRVSDQGTTLRASDLHNARATILNPFNTKVAIFVRAKYWCLYWPKVVQSQGFIKFAYFTLWRLSTLLYGQRTRRGSCFIHFESVFMFIRTELVLSVMVLFLRTRANIFLCHTIIWSHSSCIISL